MEDGLYTWGVDDDNEPSTEYCPIGNKPKKISFFDDKKIYNAFPSKGCYIYVSTNIGLYTSKKNFYEKDDYEKGYIKIETIDNKKVLKIICNVRFDIVITEDNLYGVGVDKNGCDYIISNKHVYKLIPEESMKFVTRDWLTEKEFLYEYKEPIISLLLCIRKFCKNLFLNEDYLPLDLFKYILQFCGLYNFPIQKVVERCVKKIKLE